MRRLCLLASTDSVNEVDRPSTGKLETTWAAGATGGLGGRLGDSVLGRGGSPGVAPEGGVLVAIMDGGADICCRSDGLVGGDMTTLWAAGIPFGWAGGGASTGMDEPPLTNVGRAAEPLAGGAAGSSPGDRWTPIGRVAAAASSGSGAGWNVVLDVSSSSSCRQGPTGSVSGRDRGERAETGGKEGGMLQGCHRRAKGTPGSCPSPLPAA